MSAEQKLSSPARGENYASSSVDFPDANVRELRHKSQSPLYPVAARKNHEKFRI